MGLKINAAVYSHIGGRKNNEDNFFFNGLFMAREQMNLGGEFHKEYADSWQMYAVCDGMGGAEFGEEASLRAVQGLRKFQQTCDQPDSTVYLGDTIDAISRDIDAFSLEHNMPSGACGSTIAMLIMHDWYFRVLHVGDSRVYRLRNGRLDRMTRDHSEVQRMVDCGEITPEEAWQHPLKNVITRHLGMPMEGRPLVPTVSQRMELHSGDRFLICSDGLSDVVHDRAIAALLKSDMAPETLTATLVRTALREADNMRIQSDNISVIVLDVVEVGTRENDDKLLRKKRVQQALAAAGLAVCTAGIAWMLFDIIKYLLK